MGFFSFLFRKPVVLEDEFFGRLTQEPCDFSVSRKCWFAEAVPFAPTGTLIECMIDAENANMLLAQRAFFQRFEKLYVEVLLKISLMVESDFRLKDIASPIIDFESTHRLAGLTIPQQASGPVEWELWFEQIDTSNWG
ncbi:hypothetical protein GCM10022409_06760 [Hymenobacter glaciei]|uniref:Uncharacterized protein n=1 Tax=Hymenobacter glaciei TaxID=877209 RepID=A0ABP7TFJ4_9BACT